MASLLFLLSSRDALRRRTICERMPSLALPLWLTSALLFVTIDVNSVTRHHRAFDVYLAAVLYRCLLFFVNTRFFRA